MRYIVQSDLDPRGMGSCDALPCAFFLALSIYTSETVYFRDIYCTYRINVRIYIHIYCMYVCLPVCLPVCLSVCLCVCVFVCLRVCMECNSCLNVIHVL